MRSKRLGNSDMEITVIGVGAWAMGGADWRFSWGAQDDHDSVAAIHRAIDVGINWIDTAAVYGLGHSEKVVGKAIAGMSERPLIFTKCSRVWDDSGEISSSLKSDSIRRECEASLKRLQIDRIDLYQIHRGAPDEDIEEGWAEMAKLQQEGKVRWIGVSNFTVDQMSRAHAIAPITSLQPPYSLLNRGIESEVLPFCLEHGIGVIAYSPMASGLLTGKMTPERVQKLPADDWRGRSPQFQGPQLGKNLEVASKLGEIAARRGKSASEAAIAWVLRNDAITGAIVGIRTPGQVQEIVGAADFALSDPEAAEVEAIASQ